MYLSKVSFARSSSSNYFVIVRYLFIVVLFLQPQRCWDLPIKTYSLFASALGVNRLWFAEYRQQFHFGNHFAFWAPDSSWRYYRSWWFKLPCKTNWDSQYYCRNPRQPLLLFYPTPIFYLTSWLTGPSMAIWLRFAVKSVLPMVPIRDL